MRLPTILCAGAALTVTSTLVFGDCGKDPECDELTAWSEFSAITLTLSQPGSPGTATWKGAFDHKTGDFAIDIDARYPGQDMKGTAGMVGGRVMLSKGLKLERGYEIDAIDGPVLSMRLAMIVLGRVYPQGPASLSGRVPIDYTGKVGIKYATPSASGYVAAPWRLVGNVERRGSGALAFDMLLTMPAGAEARSKEIGWKMTGEFSTRTRPVFDDRASLEGWTLYGVGPQVEERGGSTTYDYGAKPTQDSRFKTIADIRAHIAEENHPGTRDPSKNFTGFWKEKCDQAWGLQVKPYGDDGKYSVVFCGPGGCGDPSESRLTFITGDKRYEVVSEDEIFQVDRSGKKERLLRCKRG